MALFFAFFEVFLWKNLFYSRFFRTWSVRHSTPFIT